MERKVGEIFTYNGKTYRVVKGNGCVGCSFANKCSPHILGNCAGSSRLDRINVVFKEINNMEIKEVKINVPEGYEIDEENSTFECIKFKLIKKVLTYKDMAEELFNDTYYFTDRRGKIDSAREVNSRDDKNNATHRKQLERLMALNQLLNIAEYYNKKCPKEEKKIHCINFDKRNLEYFVQDYTSSIVVRGLVPIFNNKEDAKAVIDNPNFKEILDLIYKCDED